MASESKASKNHAVQMINRIFVCQEQYGRRSMRAFTARVSISAIFPPVAKYSWLHGLSAARRACSCRHAARPLDAPCTGTFAAGHGLLLRRPRGQYQRGGPRARPPRLSALEASAGAEGRFAA